VRIFTAYGLQENETHAIIALIAKAFSGQDPYQICGDGEQRQNFTYVDDIVNALVLVNDEITDTTPANVGIREYISINNVAETIFENLEWERDEITHMTDKPVSVRHRAADTCRGTAMLATGVLARGQPRGNDRLVRQQSGRGLRSREPPTTPPQAMSGATLGPTALLF